MAAPEIQNWVGSDGMIFYQGGLSYNVYCRIEIQI